MNILLTSVGRRTYLVQYFKKALANKGKIFASNSVVTVATQLADGYFLSPLIYEENYIDSLILFCIENKIEAVLSVFDIDLLILAKNEYKFSENNIQLILASVDKVEICNDKWKTYLFLKKHNILTPKTYVNILEVKKEISAKNLNYPIILKPRWGMASLGVFKVINEEELNVFYKKCKREIFESHLKYESSITPDNAILFQEFIQATEYGLDVLNDLEGNYIETFVKEKVSMRAGETDVGKTHSNTQFESLAKKLSLEINHKAILSVDCFKKEDQLYVIEMNCRISGHYPIAHMAGVNIPKQIINWLEGKETDYNLLKMDKDVLVTKDLIPVVID